MPRREKEDACRTEWSGRHLWWLELSRVGVDSGINDPDVRSGAALLDGGGIGIAREDAPVDVAIEAQNVLAGGLDGAIHVIGVFLEVTGIVGRAEIGAGSGGADDFITCQFRNGGGLLT